MKQKIYYQFPTITDEQKNILIALQSKEKFDKIALLESLVNQNQQNNFKFQGLKRAIYELKDYGQLFLDKALPKMSQSALDLLSQPLHKQMLVNNQIQEFTRKEIYQILSLSFFGLLRRQKGLECPNPSNLTYILMSEQSKEKNKCYIHYFLSANDNNEKVIYERVGFDKEYHIKQFFRNSKQSSLNGDLWESSDTQLQPIIFTQEVIEKHENCVIVDFANKYIGGGVLTHGQVQEEILFTIMPETIVAVIFSTVLDDEEIFIIKNAMRYSNYLGYGKTFNFQHCVPRNLKQDILVLDALNFSNGIKKQYTKPKIIREINKAFIGFSLSPQTLDYEKDIVTGKWGCGAFSGDVELKIIIQLIAFSASRQRLLKYHKGSLIFSTFKDQKCLDYQNKINAIINKYQTIGNICKQIFNQEGKNENLFKNLE